MNSTRDVNLGSFKFDVPSDMDKDVKFHRKFPISKDDLWLIRSLTETIPQRHYENKILSRIHNFVEVITENWQKKLQAVRDVFEETIARIAEQRQTEIYYCTCCLKEELQDIKDLLDKTENFDSEVINNLKQTWFDTLYRWKADMFDIEEQTSKLLKTAVTSYLSKLVSTRHNPCHTFDVMLTLVLELNQIIIGNVQAIIETEHDLRLLWDTHFKDWCVDYYLQAGLNALEVQEEEETEFEEEEKEIEGLAALDSILELITTSKDTSEERLKFKKLSDVATMVPHLVYLEKNWENFKDKEKIVLEVLEAEAKKLICMKKFFASLKPEERSLFGLWAKNAGYGEDAEQRFIRSAELAIFCIRQLKTLMLQTVDLWDDLTDRLEALKCLVELVHRKQKIQNAALFLEWEINMNFAIDELRQAHSLVVLENMWNIHIDKLFFEYKNMLEQFLQYEKITLDSYSPLSKMTFELFLSALNVLISDASPSSNTEIIPETSISNYNMNNLEDSNFRLTEIIITCVTNATIGYVEFLMFFRDEIRENIDILDCEWVVKKKADLDWQFTLKEESMEHRVYRMKTDVLDIRAIELRMHELVVYRQTEAIREKLNQLSSIDITMGIQPLVEDFYAVADEVAYLNTKVTPGGFPRIIARLEQAKKKFIDLCLRCDHDNQRAFEHIDRCFEWMSQINIQLLQDLKLFSEGGNFSSDEVTGVLFVIQRLDKEISNEKKAIDNRFSKGVSLNDMEIGHKIEKFIAYIKKTQNELLHKSNMRLIMNRARRAIKREIFNGRVLLKKAESTLSESDEVEDTSILPQLLDVTKNALLFLAIPDDFIDLSGNKKRRKSSSNNSFRRQTVTSKSIMRKGRSRSPMAKSSRSLLLKFREEEEDVPNNFLCRVLHIISKCKETLHSQIYKYTSQALGRRSESSLRISPKALVKAKVQRGNNMFQEFEPELRELYRQSLIVWLDMVNDLLRIFATFGNKVTTVLDDEYKEFENLWLSSIEIIGNQFREELQDFDRVSAINKEERIRGLKTMFGHPKHKDLLAALTNEAVSFCKSQTQDLKTIVLYRRNQLKQLLMMFFDEKKPFLKDLYFKVEKLYENEELENILFKMAHHLLSRSKARKVFLNLIHPRQQKYHPTWTEVKPVAEIGSDSDDLSSSWNLKTDVKALIKSVSGRLRMIINSRDERDETAVEKDWEDDLVLKEPQHYVQLIKSLQQVINLMTERNVDDMTLLRTALKMCQLGKLSLAIYIEELQTWLLDWRTHCARLTDLFTYGPAPATKDKLQTKQGYKRGTNAPKVQSRTHLPVTMPNSRITPSGTRSRTLASGTPALK